MLPIPRVLIQPAAGVVVVEAVAVVLDQPGAVVDLIHAAAREVIRIPIRADLSVEHIIIPQPHRRLPISIVLIPLPTGGTAKARLGGV